MIEFEVIPDTNVVEFVIDEKVTKEELEELHGAVEKVIADHGKVRLLKQLKSGGSTPSIEFGAMWDNLAWAFKNMKNVERVAGVADQTWMGKLTDMADPFFKAEMRFFPTDRVDDARAWLRGD